jgi:hypothetical protein
MVHYFFVGPTILQEGRKDDGDEGKDCNDIIHFLACLDRIGLSAALIATWKKKNIMNTTNTNVLVFGFNHHLVKDEYEFSESK